MLYLFDFDGPILDVSERYYAIYHSFLASNNVPCLDKDLFWELKRGKVSDSEILALTGGQSLNADFAQFKLSKIEAQDFLQLDTIQEGAWTLLNSLQKKDIPSVLVTLRTNQENLYWQLDYLGLTAFFKKVLAPQGDIKPKWKLKQQAILDYFGVVPEHSVFVGDTETDIATGQAIGSKTVAVLSGIRNWALLKACQPDVIIPNVSFIDLHNI